MKSGFPKSQRIFLSTFLLAILCLISRPLFAATAVSSVKLVDQDTGGHNAKIYFNLTNESGVGKSGGGWVWVFAKYSTDPGSGSRTWGHCSISEGADYGGASTITIPSDYKGAFIQGSGTAIKLVWQYGADGLSDADVKTAGFRIKVFVIDMIKAPAGAFNLGESPGGGEFGCGAPGTTVYCSECGSTPFQHCSNGGGTPGNTWHQSYGAFFYASLYGTCCGGIVSRTSFYISSEGSISVGYMDAYGNGAWNTGDLICQSGEDGDAGGPVPAEFPKGVSSFYFMEHELSQGQYRDFLNTLTRTQQVSRVATDISGDTLAVVYVMIPSNTPDLRNTIRAPASGNGTTAPIEFGCDLNGNGVFDESDDGEWIAMNYLSSYDLLAYADWAGLRPMTEFEYEKAASGAGGIHQYPWASAYFDLEGNLNEPIRDNPDINNRFFNAGTAYEGVESVSDVYHLVNWNSQPGYPVRSGAFYGDGNSWNGFSVTPEGPYGGYDLSGNLWETVFTITNPYARGFQGTHGDGALDSNGSYTNSDWAGGNMGAKGGGWNSTSSELRTGDRSNANNASWVASRNAFVGGRLARTAP